MSLSSHNSIDAGIIFQINPTYQHIRNFYQNITSIIPNFSQITRITGLVKADYLKNLNLVKTGSILRIILLKVYGIELDDYSKVFNFIYLPSRTYSVNMITPELSKEIKVLSPDFNVIFNTIILTTPLSFNKSNI